MVSSSDLSDEVLVFPMSLDLENLFNDLFAVDFVLGFKGVT